MLDFLSPVTVKDSRAYFLGISAFAQAVPHSYLGPGRLYINAGVLWAILDQNQGIFRVSVQSQSPRCCSQKYLSGMFP